MTAKVQSMNLVFYPPGITVVLNDCGEIREESIDLPPLSSLTDIHALAIKIVDSHEYFQRKHAKKIEAALDQILKMQTIGSSSFYACYASFRLFIQ